jgi:hypothetical protein
MDKSELLTNQDSAAKWGKLPHRFQEKMGHETSAPAALVFEKLTIMANGIQHALKLDTLHLYNRSGSLY